MIQLGFLISCSTLPLTLQTSSAAASESAHDTNSFKNSSKSNLIFHMHNNSNQSKSDSGPESSSLLELHNTNNARKQRVYVFRPLFVYRQEQAMKKRSKTGIPIDPDRFYHYPYYPYYPHQYGSAYPHRIFESYPFRYNDYVSNEISADRFPAYDMWYH